MPLYLAYQLHQAIPAQLREQPNNNVYAQLITYILKVPFIQYDHKIVNKMLLENLVRYSGYFIKEPTYLDDVPTIFFSQKGIYSNEP